MKFTISFADEIMDVDLSEVVDLLEDDATDDDIEEYLSDCVNVYLESNFPMTNLRGDTASFIAAVRALLDERKAEEESEGG